ncbi:YCF48-related protein [Calditrichota bacterium LG25]
MRYFLQLILILGMANLLFGQSWEVVKVGEMEYYPNSGVFFNADTGLFVGDDGAVMMTTDGGVSGDIVRYPEYDGAPSWSDVGFANDLVGFACAASGGFIYKTEDGGYTWTQVGDTAQFTFDLNDIAVVNENTVYVAGDDGVLKTTDGGATWTKINYTFEVSGSVQKLDGGIAFCNENVGVVATSANKAATWYTHDGGQTWNFVQLIFPGGISKRLYDVAAYGDSTIAIAGYHFTIFLSQDGGKTYQQIANWTPNYVQFYSVQLLDENTVIAGGSDGHVTMTTDGGNSWNDIDLPAAHSVIFVYFVDQNTGYVFARDGQWFKTTDGGVSYTPLLGWPNVDFKGLAISPANTILSVCFKGDATISTDGGYNWTYPDNLLVGARSTLYTADFANENLALVGGYKGVLYRSTDGGLTWQEVPNPMYDDGKSIYVVRFVDENLVFAAGSKGYIMKSEDGGQTWTLVGNSETSTVYDIWPVASKQILAGCSSGKLLVSTATLDSFYLKYDYGLMNLREIEFKGDHGVVVGTKGYIFHTTTANWDTLQEVFVEPDGDDFFGVAFVNDTLVYAVGEKGKIYYSNDAGLTWQKDDSVTIENLERVEYADGKLWAVGANGVILKKDFEPQVATQNLFINEFMASNDSAFADEYGEYDDWIEIYNANDFPVDIGGMYITDDLGDPTAYQIPDTLPAATTIPAKGFLILWADKQPEQGVLHVNIKLSASGEQIGLSEYFEGNYRFIDSLTFGEQTTDISYGRRDDGGSEWVFFSTATPGETNANGVIVSIDHSPTATITNYELKQNYPNPFNPLTTIEFSLKKAGQTTLTIYNIAGQKVATVINKKLNPGAYKVKINASKFASGVYFYELKSGNFKAIRKMLLVK